MTRRLLLSYLTVTVFVLVVLEVPLASFFADRQRQQLFTDIERDALILATIYEDALDRGLSYSVDPAVDYAARTGTRVVVVDVEGRSIVDSERSPNLDFSNREEVAVALTGRITTGRRASVTLGRDLIYVAVPVASGGTVYGAVRVTADPADVESRIHRFWWSLAGVGVVVLAAMALVGWVVARSVIQPIEAVRSAAGRAGSGDLDVEIDPGDAPDELKELVLGFNAMAGRLKDLMQRQRAFVADASHQLRTPLTAIRLRLENLEDEVSGAARSDAAAALIEVDRLGRLVDQLLVLVRTEDRVESPEPLDLAAVIRERHDLWAPTAGEHGVEIVSAGVESPVWAMAAPGAVEQVLDNLLANALSVSPRNTVIRVEVRSGEGTHELHVIDQGPGLTFEEVEHAFERFWRGSGTGEGTGLGLAIVRELAEISGGSARLEAAGEGGLDAVVTLPAASRP